MNTIRQLWERFFPPIHPIPAGMYHYQAPADAQFPYRLHLRLEPDGAGILIVNASTVVHLNRTAAEFAYHLVKNTKEDLAIDTVARRYNVRREIIQRDYADLLGRLRTLIDTPDLDPVTYLDFSRLSPASGALVAPYRIDCALTYRLPASHALNAHVAPLDRVTRELDRAEWQEIMQKAWNAGVPQAVFTGGEPTLRADLCALIGFGETLGMVTGLITNGLRLVEHDYLEELLQSGLDHVMIIFDPGDEQAWEALRDTLAEDIAVTVHLTVTQPDLADFADTLARLVSMGTTAISLSVNDTALTETLQAAQSMVAEHHLRLVSDLPVPYSQIHPVTLEDIGNIASHTTGLAQIYVEPDGDVLPRQGAYQTIMGNLLNGSWEDVWANAIAVLVPAAS